MTFAHSLYYCISVLLYLVDSFIVHCSSKELLLCCLNHQVIVTSTTCTPVPAPPVPAPPVPAPVREMSMSSRSRAEGSHSHSKPAGRRTSNVFASVRSSDLMSAADVRLFASAVLKSQRDGKSDFVFVIQVNYLGSKWDIQKRHADLVFFSDMMAPALKDSKVAAKDFPAKTVSARSAHCVLSANTYPADLTLPPLNISPYFSI